MKSSIVAIKPMSRGKASQAEGTASAMAQRRELASPSQGW